MSVNTLCNAQGFLIYIQHQDVFLQVFFCIFNIKYFQEHLEDVKSRLGKSLVQAGGGLLEDEISGGSNSPSCSNVLIFVPALAMYGLLLILTVVGKYTVWGQKVCNFVFRKLFHHYGQSHLSLDTMGSHV